MKTVRSISLGGVVACALLVSSLRAELVNISATGVLNGSWGDFPFVPPDVSVPLPFTFEISYDSSLLTSRGVDANSATYTTGYPNAKRRYSAPALNVSTDWTSFELIIAYDNGDLAFTGYGKFLNPLLTISFGQSSSGPARPPVASPFPTFPENTSVFGSASIPNSPYSGAFGPITSLEITTGSPVPEPNAFATAGAALLAALALRRRLRPVARDRSSPPPAP